jgi:predicted nucleic acid-binding protein
VRIVLDTSVLVSGLLNPFGTPADVVRMVVSGSVTLCVDARILLEYAEVLARPRFAFPPGTVHTLLDLIAADGLVVAATHLAHYPPAARAGMAVLAPAEFLRAFRLGPERGTQPPR